MLQSSLSLAFNGLFIMQIIWMLSISDIKRNNLSQIPVFFEGHKYMQKILNWIAVSISFNEAHSLQEIDNLHNDLYKVDARSLRWLFSIPLTCKKTSYSVGAIRQINNFTSCIRSLFYKDFAEFPTRILYFHVFFLQSPIGRLRWNIIKE